MNKSILELHAEYFEALDKKLIRLHNESIKSGKKVSEYYPGLLPMFYRDKNPVSSDVLISGINPSFTKSFYKSIDSAIFSYDAFLKQSLVEQEITIEKLIGIQESLKYGSGCNENKLNQIAYFKATVSLLNSVEYSGKWDHCDVFPIRCTSQQVFLKVLNEFDDYKSKAIDLYLHHLKVGKYKLVLVFNRSASLFILKSFNLIPSKNGIFSPNKIYGFYETDLLPNTKFFLYKILSGRNKPHTDEYEQLVKFLSTYLQTIK
jgi:hypothetical protein